MGAGMIDTEKYRLWSKLSVYRRHVEQAKNIIAEALNEIPGTWALSYSGGKDSTALLGLLLSAGWRGPLFHFYYAETPTANTDLAKQMAEKYGLELHLLPVAGAFDVFCEVGHFFVHPTTPEEKAATNKMLAGYKKAVNEYVASQGWTGQFLGLRKAESRVRRMTLSRKGMIYQTSDRSTWTACPLANWTGEDVWAYILTNNLPYLESYALGDDPERERSETTWLAAESLWRHGMAARLKKERPDEFYRLAAMWPEIKQYV